MASWAIPMGEQVSIEAERRKRYEQATYGTSPCEPYSVAKPEHDWNGAFCATCGADEAGSFATEPCPGFESFPEEPHQGHFSRLSGIWWCDTCDSPYCDLA